MYIKNVKQVVLELAVQRLVDKYTPEEMAKIIIDQQIVLDQYNEAIVELNERTKSIITKLEFN